MNLNKSENKLKKYFSKYEKYNLATETEQNYIHTFFESLQNDFEIDDFCMENMIEETFNRNMNVTYFHLFSRIFKFDLNKFKTIANSQTLFSKYQNLSIYFFSEERTNEYTKTQSLAKYYYDVLTKEKPNYFITELDISFNEKFTIIKNIIEYMSININLGELISISISSKISLSLDKIGDIFEHILNDEYAIDSHHSPDELFNLKVFKLLIENNSCSENNLEKLLTFLYCRQDIVRLQIIKLYSPNLLDINLVQLIKITFYGRHLSLQFVLDNLLDKFNSITNEHNIYDIRLLNYNESICVQRDIFKYTNKQEAPVIGTKNFEKVFELINSHTPCRFDKTIIESWLKTILHNEEYYFINKEDLLAVLNLNLKTKENIKNAVQMLGSNIIWNILRSENSDVLDILLC